MSGSRRFDTPTGRPIDPEAHVAGILNGNLGMAHIPEVAERLHESLSRAMVGIPAEEINEPEYPDTEA